MRSSILLLAACLGLPVSAALAQTRPGPAYFLRHPTPAPRLDLGLLPPVPGPALPPVAAVPTVRAAAYGPLPARDQDPAPPRNLTDPRGFPAYDPLQRLPEFYRQHTLPEARIEPWPVQLLRGLLQ